MANEQSRAPGTPAAKLQQQPGKPQESNGGAGVPAQLDNELLARIAAKLDAPAAPHTGTGYIPQAEENARKHRELLEANGWESAGVDLWRDPAGSQARATPTREILLPQRDGPPQKVVQMVGPPCNWDYVTFDAVRIQMERDAAGKVEGGSPMERLQRLEKLFDAQTQKTAAMLAELKKMARRPMPDKPENLTRELGDLRRMILMAA